MRKGYLEVREPIWNGGKPAVGIAEWRLKDVDIMDIRISYQNKKGEILYPRMYRISVGRIRLHPKQTLSDKTQVFMVPLSEMPMVQEGHEERCEQLAKSQEAINAARRSKASS